MNRSRLLALAHKLEGKDPIRLVPIGFEMKGSLALDQEIADALAIPVRPFTTSIDAALSLTSREEYDYEEGIVNGHVGGTPRARVGQHESFADTPALSICAASLRAIATEPRKTYAVGFKDDAGAYGTFFGPTVDLQACLRYVPDDHEMRGVCYVLQYDDGGLRCGVNRIVARWRPSTSSWVQRNT